ncbi:MAG: acetyl-CoA C-acyltransferase [Nitrospirae bacterium]|nr:acetyl-CoA C-acyltransferase [Nitrospirota bacterium]
MPVRPLSRTGFDPRQAVIVGAVRTPIGLLNGALSSLSAPQLGSLVIAEVLRQTGLYPDEVEQVIMGNVLSSGLGQAPARQAALGAGLPQNVKCLTINKVCGSGLKAVMLAEQAIRNGEADAIIAGGMESMSNAPYLLPKARRGYRAGHDILIDSMLHDGLWDVYNDFHMGSGAELCARKYRITREQQDDFAVRSFERAFAAQHKGLFRSEIHPIEVPQDRGPSLRVASDEQTGRADFKKLRRLPPAFEKDGTVTAGNASARSDGAAVLVILSARKARQLKIEPFAAITASAEASTAPEWFSIAPVQAVRTLLETCRVPAGRVDLFEIHEAFAATALAVIEDLKLPPDRVNLRGGAIALGHPIGASGARILTTLVHLMKDRGSRRGLAALCIGGGEAVAMMLERTA